MVAAGVFGLVAVQAPRALVPTSKPTLVFGATTVNDLEKHFGNATRGPGEHPGSLASWNFTDGTYFSVDGSKTRGPGNTIVEGIFVSNWVGQLGKSSDGLIKQGVKCVDDLKVGLAYEEVIHHLSPVATRLKRPGGYEELVVRLSNRSIFLLFKDGKLWACRAQ